MAIIDSTGAKLTKAQLLAKTTTVAQDPIVQFNEDIWESFPYPGGQAFEDGPGAGRRKLFRAGMKVRQSQIDAMYAASVATIDTIAPASGLAAGGTAVTITGSGFAGVKGVTFGGTAATNVKVVSDNKITCTAPAHAAGAVAVVVQDASGDVTKANGYTYN